MKAHAIVWGPTNKGVTLQTREGNTALAVFHEYKEAVRTLAGFEDANEMRIIEVEVILA